MDRPDRTNGHGITVESHKIHGLVIVEYVTSLVGG